jgi:hypothetical protein
MRFAPAQTVYARLTFLKARHADAAELFDAAAAGGFRAHFLGPAASNTGRGNSADAMVVARQLYDEEEEPPVGVARTRAPRAALRSVRAALKAAGRAAAADDAGALARALQDPR